jgi:hypothetical protein
VTPTTPFPGNAKVKLIGVPANTVCPDVEFNKDTKEFAFHLATQKNTPAGIHKNLYCQVIVTMNGEPILHNLGSSEFRVDVPLPPKPNAPPPPATTAAKPPPPPMPNAPPMKRLTRLEQLRLEQQEREKTGTAPPMPKK